MAKEQLYTQEGYQKLIEAKRRPKEKAFPFVVGNKEDIKKVATLTKKQQKIVDLFFPGPLTIIVKKNENVADYLTNGKDTIAIRMPDNEFVLDLIKELGKPILLTSANLSGEEAALNSEEAFNIFDGVVPFIVEGEAGSSMASTIIDLTQDEIKIVREGKIGLKELEEAVEWRLY